jgi:hypothetical protein
MVVVVVVVVVVKLGGAAAVALVSRGIAGNSSAWNSRRVMNSDHFPVTFSPAGGPSFELRKRVFQETLTGWKPERGEEGGEEGGECADVDDEEGAESFPASDPPAHVPIIGERV